MFCASEYIWWPFLNCQIIKTCEYCKEATIKIVGINQKMQFDFVDLIVDENNRNIRILVAFDRFYKILSTSHTKTSGAKDAVEFLKS